MNQFNYNAYLKNNPLLKETNGTGNYVQPEKMFGSPDRISNRDYDNMTDDELDAAEKAGDLNSSNAPLGPDEELMEESELDFGIEFGKSLKSLEDTVISAQMEAKRVQNQDWINALDRIASIIDQLDSYVVDKSRKLGVIKKP
jgi:hypothetical protein